MTFYTGDMRDEAPVNCGACGYEGPWKDFHGPAVDFTPDPQATLPEPGDDDWPF